MCHYCSYDLKRSSPPIIAYKVLNERRGTENAYSSEAGGKHMCYSKILVEEIDEKGKTWLITNTNSDTYRKEKDRNGTKCRHWFFFLCLFLFLFFVCLFFFCLFFCYYFLVRIRLRGYAFSDFKILVCYHKWDFSIFQTYEILVLEFFFFFFFFFFEFIRTFGSEVMID